MRPGFRTLYARDVARGLSLTEAAPNVLEQDLEGLPILLQTYLRRVGVVGAPRVRNFRTRFSGQMRRHPKAVWEESSGSFPYARFRLEELIYNVGHGGFGGTASCIPAIVFELE